MNTKVIGKIIWKSVKDSFSSKIWRWLFGGGSSSLLGFLLVPKTFFDITVRQSFLIVGICLVSLFFLRFILFAFINSFKYLHSVYRESKYGDAIILLKDGFAKIHHYRKMDDQDKTKEAFIDVLTTMCNSLQRAFVGKNSCDCSVSIKVPVTGTLNADAPLMNICRDAEHRTRDDANYQSVQHTVCGNTPFYTIFNNVTRGKTRDWFYINNDIPKSGSHYLNTSRDVYPNGVLPYNSEIVVPIIPTERHGMEIYLPLGFLCIDCMETNKFEQKYDVPLIEGVADGIYDIMKANITR